MTEQQRRDTPAGAPAETPPQVGSAPAAGVDPTPTRTARPTPASRPTATLKRTRTGGLWVGLTLGAVVLVLLLVFILQNLAQVQIYFFWANGQLPLGVALLLAAVAGVLLVAIPGYGRILQLRRAARRGRR